MPTLVLQPDENHATSRDTLIADALYENNNFGSFGLLTIGTQGITKGQQGLFRGILRFDLTALTGASITDATLTLTASSGSVTGDTFSIHRLTQPNWTELGVTWNVEPAVVRGDERRGRVGCRCKR